MGDHRCGWPQSACGNCERISRAQRRLWPRNRRIWPCRYDVNRTRRQYLRTAHWYELEAQRGYASAWRDRIYAQNMRWCAELAGLYGDGTFLELLERSGHPHPCPRGLPDTEAEWLAASPP